MEGAFRPFCKIKSVNPGVTTSMALTDSRGSGVFANYVKVEGPVLGQVSGYFFVGPSATYSSAVSITADPSSTAAPASFGALGTTFIAAELFLNPVDACSSIVIINRLNSAGPVDFAVTYGVRTLLNPLKQNNLNKGT